MFPHVKPKINVLYFSFFVVKSFYKEGLVMKIGERMKEIRKSRGWNQDQVAKLLGVTRQAVSHYERGIREPNYEMVEAFADRFNVTIDYLQGRDNNSIYYLSPEVAELAQNIHENKYLKELFDVAYDANPETLKLVHDILIVLKRKDNNKKTEP